MSGAPRASAIVAEGLGMRFGSFKALEGVGFEVAAGSITGLVGPNGAGKTTLLRILASLLLPTYGRAMVGGHDVARSPQKVRQIIGYLPDFAGIYQDMRVDEYLRFFADAHGLGKREREGFIAEALELSGLRERSRDFIEELSRGMRAKLSFVRALAGSPGVLLLDEPLSNLDPVARSEMLGIIARMRSEGRSVLVSSHIISDLEKLCDHVLFIHGGRLLTEGEGAEGKGALVSLRLSAAPAGAVERLRTLPGVESVDPSPEGGRFTIHVAPGADPSAVLKAVVDSGIGVLEWKPVEPSLEERLIRVVKGGAKG